jgi:acylphosphatase
LLLSGKEMNKNLIKIHIIISGKVQKIGFRRFVKNTAQKLSLSGWVRNLPNDKVETVAVGTKPKIDLFVGIIKKGNLLSTIDNVLIIKKQKTTNQVSSSFKISQTVK